MFCHEALPLQASNHCIAFIAAVPGSILLIFGKRANERFYDSTEKLWEFDGVKFQPGIPPPPCSTGELNSLGRYRYIYIPWPEICA